MSVIDFPGETRLDLDPKRIFETALEHDFECVLVVGWKEDGDMYLAGSSANVIETIGTLDIAKAALLKDMVE